MAKTKRTSKDKRLLVAKDMPPLKRTVGERYSFKTDEVIKWISQRPGLIMYILDKLVASKYIVYNPDAGTWQGANYGCTGDSAEFE